MMVPSAETSMQQPPWNAGPKGLAAEESLSARRQVGDRGQHRARQIHQRQRVAEQERASAATVRIFPRRELDHDILQPAPFADADISTPVGPASPGASDPNRPNALDAASATPTDALGPPALADCGCPSDRATACNSDPRGACRPRAGFRHRPPSRIRRTHPMAHAGCRRRAALARRARLRGALPSRDRATVTASPLHRSPTAGLMEPSSQPIPRTS
jgi:hypothetical protein